MRVCQDPNESRIYNLALIEATREKNGVKTLNGNHGRGVNASHYEIQSTKMNSVRYSNLMVRKVGIVDHLI